MASVGGILSIARTALSAQQAALQVTGHNIANAATEGYTRQRTVLGAGIPFETSYGAIGTGVKVETVQRARDAVLDTSFRRESGSASGDRLRQQMLSQVEGIFGEPSETGLASRLDLFWSSWGDLAAHPSNLGAKQAVRERGAQLVNQFHWLGRELDTLGTDATERLTDAVGRLNDLTASVADLNTKIVAAEAGGRTAGDLRDTRDRHLDAIAKIAPLQVLHRANGTVGAVLGNLNIVDGANAAKLEVKAVGGVWSVETAAGTKLSADKGEAAALMKLVNTDLPRIDQQLDELASALVGAVNAAHNPGSVSGLDFFNASGTTAASIALSTNVAAAASAVRSGSTGTGSNDIALALTQLRDTKLSALSNRTAGDAYNDAIVELGTSIATATDDAQVHEVLAEQADIRRTSSFGVSTDEEFIKLIQHQTAYQAAARLVNTADEMLQAVLGMV